MTTQSTYKSDAVKVDKNKSAEQYIVEVEQIYLIPTLIREKYPELVKMIYETESMDVEEREYWLQIMPIMSEEQILKLKGIMNNEHEQLKAIEAKYSGSPQVREIDEAAIRMRQEQLRAAELEVENSEKEEEERLLRELEDLL